MLETHPLDPADVTPRAQLRAHAAAAKASTPSLAESRSSFDALMASMRGATGVEYAQDTIAGVPGWWARPADARRDAVLLHLHGGGFTRGSATTHKLSIGQYASHAGLAAFIPDYRLAPEYPFPAAFDDVQAVYEALAKTHAHVVVSGDSAGGNLALALLPLRPRAIVALSPWVDLTHAGESLRSRADADPYLTAAGLAISAAQYVGTHDAHDPRISPLFAGSSDVPILVVVGDDEILLDDSLRYAARHPNAEAHVWMGMPHVFPANIGFFRASALALADIGAFVRRVL